LLRFLFFVTHTKPKTLLDDARNMSGLGGGRRVRFSISLPRAIAEEFDQLVEGMGYANRSKAIHDAISAFIAENKQLGATEYVAGTLTCVYYRDVKGIIETIEELQHRYSTTISSTVHIALGSRRCMKIFVVHGPSKAILEFAQELRTRRGVRHLRVAVVG
jgi:CopG family nickel-responsive transcriptional regulator